MQACGEASMAVAVSDLNDAEQEQLVSLLKRVRNTLESK